MEQFLQPPSAATITRLWVGWTGQVRLERLHEKQQKGTEVLGSIVKITLRSKKQNYNYQEFAHQRYYWTRNHTHEINKTKRKQTTSIQNHCKMLDMQIKDLLIKRFRLRITTIWRKLKYSTPNWIKYPQMSKCGDINTLIQKYKYKTKQTKTLIDEMGKKWEEFKLMLHELMT